MNESRFDVLAGAFGAIADRRAAMRMVASAASGLLALMVGFDADARKRKKGKKKKKKKSGQCKSNQEKCGRACCNANQSCIGGTCLGACQFSNDDDLKTMTLQEDCATTETIVIADQFTLEGDGKTIHMAGPVSGYQSVTVANTAVRAGLLIQDGTGSVKNVTIDQDALACGGGQAHSAIAMVKGVGDIEAVDIVVTRENVQCYRGIDAEAGANNAAVNVRGVTIGGGHTRAMAISGPTPPDGTSLVAGEISDCTISDALFGMLVNASKQQITGNAVNANNAILIGVFPSNVLIDDNTITGLSGATNANGILFNDGTKGTVSNNTVSGFTCGVSILGDADVTVSGNNTFSANTDNVCPPPP